MKNVIVYAILIALLVSCGGPSDPTLTGAKIDLKSKRNDDAYKKLSDGLYAPAGKKEKLKAIPEAWFELAKLHKGKDENAKASAALDQVSKLDTKKLWSEKATNLKKLWAAKDFNAAVKKFNEAAKLDVDARKKKYGEAALLLQSSNEFETTAKTYNTLGKAQAQIDESNKAIESYKKAIELEPKNASYQADLATEYFSSKKYTESIVEFDKALALDPKNQTALKYKAFALQNNQDYPGAVQAYKALLVAYPNDEDGAKNLAIAEAVSIQMQAQSFITKYNEAVDKKAKNPKKYLKECAAILEQAVASEAHKESADMWGTLAIVYANLGNSKLAKKAEKNSKKFTKQ